MWETVGTLDPNKAVLFPKQKATPMVQPLEGGALPIYDRDPVTEVREYPVEGASAGTVSSHGALQAQIAVTREKRATAQSEEGAALTEEGAFKAFDDMVKEALGDDAPYQEGVDSLCDSKDQATFASLDELERQVTMPPEATAQIHAEEDRRFLDTVNQMASGVEGTHASLPATDLPLSALLSKRLVGFIATATDTSPGLPASGACTEAPRTVALWAQTRERMKMSETGDPTARAEMEAFDTLIAESLTGPDTTTVTASEPLSEQARADRQLAFEQAKAKLLEEPPTVSQRTVIEGKKRKERLETQIRQLRAELNKLREKAGLPRIGLWGYTTEPRVYDDETTVLPKVAQREDAMTLRAQQSDDKLSEEQKLDEITDILNGTKAQLQVKEAVDQDTVAPYDPDTFVPRQELGGEGAPQEVRTALQTLLQARTTQALRAQGVRYNTIEERQVMADATLKVLQGFAAQNPVEYANYALAQLKEGTVVEGTHKDSAVHPTDSAQEEALQPLSERGAMGQWQRQPLRVPQKLRARLVFTETMLDSIPVTPDALRLSDSRELGAIAGALGVKCDSWSELSLSLRRGIVTKALQDRAGKMSRDKVSMAVAPEAIPPAFLENLPPTSILISLSDPLLEALARNFGVWESSSWSMMNKKEKAALIEWAELSTEIGEGEAPPEGSLGVTDEQDSQKERSIMSGVVDTVKAAGATLAKDSQDASWRAAAKQLTKLVREPLVALLHRNLGPSDPSLRVKIAEFLDTEMGSIVVTSLLATGATLVPMPAPMQAQVVRLAQELRVKAMADGMDLTADVVMGPLRAVISTYLQGMPAEAAELETETAPVQIPSASISDHQGVDNRIGVSVKG